MTFPPWNAPFWDAETQSCLRPGWATTQAGGGTRLAGHIPLLIYLISILGQYLVNSQFSQTPALGWEPGPWTAPAAVPSCSEPQAWSRLALKGRPGRSHYCSLSSHPGSSSSLFFFLRERDFNSFPTTSLALKDSHSPHLSPDTHRPQPLAPTSPAAVPLTTPLRAEAPPPATSEPGGDSRLPVGCHPPRTPAGLRRSQRGSGRRGLGFSQGPRLTPPPQGIPPLPR